MVTHPPGLNRARRWSGLAHDPALRRALAYALGLRLALGLWAWLSLWFRPDRKDAALGSVYDAHTAYGALLGPWQHFDALIYERLAVLGYRPQTTDAAFFPLYPGLIRAAVGPFDDNVWALPIAALALSTLAAAVAFFLLDRLVSDDVGADVGARTVAYTALAPTSFFLVAVYPESLFLALSVASVLAARRRRFWASSLLAAAAAVCRPQGIFLVAPLVVEIGADWWRQRAAGGRSWRPAYLSWLVPVVVLAGFLAAVARATGVSEFEAESRGWGVVAATPWGALADATRFVLSGAPAAGQLNVLAGYGLVVATVLAVRRLPAAYVAYLAVSAMGLLTHEITAFPAGGPLKSTDRFVLAVFPLFVLLALGTRRHPWLHRGLLALFGLLLVVQFDHFVHDDFVG